MTGAIYKLDFCPPHPGFQWQIIVFSFGSRGDGCTLAGGFQPKLIIYFKLKVFDQGISETWGMEIQQPNVLPVEKGNLPKTQGPGFSYHVCVCVGSKNPGFSHGRTELQN